MNKKQLALSLSILSASTVTYAEKLEFNNGDTLDVILVKHSNSTLTFSHPALGEQTIKKVNISNLSSLNLGALTKETDSADKGAETLNSDEADEAQALAEIKAAKEKVIIAKKRLMLLKSN